jgi:hypothetical protein
LGAELLVLPVQDEEGHVVHLIFLQGTPKLLAPGRHAVPGTSGGNGTFDEAKLAAGPTHRFHARRVRATKQIGVIQGPALAADRLARRSVKALLGTAIDAVTSGAVVHKDFGAVFNRPPRKRLGKGCHPRRFAQRHETDDNHRQHEGGGPDDNLDLHA